MYRDVYLEGPSTKNSQKGSMRRSRRVTCHFGAGRVNSNPTTPQTLTP